MATLLSFVTTTILNLGYVGIFGCMIIESASIPLPSEIVMGFAGYLVFIGKIGFWEAVLVGSIGNVIGATIMYYLGKYIGYPFIDKHGKWFHLKRADIERTEKWFALSGDLAVFVSQLLPVVRTFRSFPAGMLQINFPRFIIYTFVGSVIWCTLLTLIGLKLGENWSTIDIYFRPLQWVIITGILLAASYYVWKRFFKKSRLAV